MQVRKGRKVAKHCVFPMICGSGGSKSRLAKAAGRSQLARWEMKICTPLWREAHFEVKMYKAHHCRTTFGSWDVEKVRAVVARSTFPSQNVQNTPGSDHFWKLRCRKSARRCGAKHISKSKCTKHPRRCGARHISKSKVSKTDGLGALLEVEMLNKCTPLWHEAHFEVKSVKNWRSRATFGRSDVVSHGRRKGLCTLPKGSKTCRFCSSFNYNHYTPLHSTPLHSTPPHSTTLHYTTVHSTTTTLITRHLHLPLRLRLPLHLHYTIYSYSYNYNYNYATLHYTTLHYTTLHCTALHYTRLQYISLPYIALHYSTLHSLHHHKCDCNYTTLISPHHNYNSTTLQLQLQLRYTTLHPAVVVTGQVTTATISRNTTPTAFQSISGFALPSVIHNNQALL